MGDRNFVMSLAKLVIAAAWADGELQNEEVNALKDLLFGLEGIAGADWAELEIFMDSPVGPQERERLLGEVLERIRSDEDKELVVATLEGLVRADGVVTDQEQALLEEIRNSVSDVSTGVLGRLSKMIKGAVARRDEGYGSAAQRDDQIDDYIKNTIYYQIKSQGEEIDLPEQTLRKLCLAAGLLARISAVDSEISDEEKQTIENTLVAQWGLSHKKARVVAQISCERTLRGLDNFRLARGFFECTTIDERRNFLKCLFQIANASDKTSYDETEEIRKIAGSLKLTHKDFIEAKLTIPDEDREVL